MSILPRAVLLDTVKVLVVVLIALSLLFALGAAAREGVRKGLPPTFVIRGVPYLLPEVLRLTLPASLLFAICTVFGRMSATEEITAIKAQGISPARIIVPVLVLAYLLSLLTFWLYDVCATWSRPGLCRLVASSVDRLAYEALRQDGVFKVGGVTLSTRSVRGRKLIEPTLEFAASHGGATSVRAREAELESVGTTGRVKIRARGSVIKLPERITVALPGEFSHQFTVDTAVQRDDSHLSPAEIKMSRIADQIRLETERIAKLERSVNVGTGGKNSRRMAQHRLRLHRLLAERQRRLSGGFAVLGFACIGIPVSIRLRSRESMTVFFACVVPIALCYYPLLVIGEEAARRGFHPSLSVWLAPTVLIALGAKLMHRQIRF